MVNVCKVTDLKVGQEFRQPGIIGVCAWETVARLDVFEDCTMIWLASQSGNPFISSAYMSFDNGHCVEVR